MLDFQSRDTIKYLGKESGGGGKAEGRSIITGCVYSAASFIESRPLKQSLPEGRRRKANCRSERGHFLVNVKQTITRERLDGVLGCLCKKFMERKEWVVGGQVRGILCCGG